MADNVFIMAHMRSRSSLLAHIIMSNDQVVGMGESNATYKEKWRMSYMKLKCLKQSQILSMNKLTFLDQINHNSKTPDQKILLNDNLKIIFLIREPAASIDSIMKLTKKHYEAWTYQKAKEYYCERIQFLQEIKSKKNTSQFIKINSDDLINNTQEVLNQLTTFLKLESPLTEQYKVYNFTGIQGDPSNQIRSGKIINTIKEKPQTHDHRAHQLFEHFLNNDART